MFWLKDKIIFLKRILLQKPYLYWWVLLSPLYALVMFGVHYYIYNGDPSIFFKTFPAWYTASYVVLTLLISILLSLTITLLVAKIREIQYKSMSLGVLGVFFGSLAAGCPGCVFGLFPILAATLGFGSGLTLAILPFNGIEFQILTLLLFIGSILILAKETDLSCKIKR